MAIQISHDAPNSLWAATANPHPQSSVFEGEVFCDAVVIGAGFTGLSAALKLVETGASVTVLDAQDIGFGASGRNGGQVNPMLPFVSPEHLHKLVGSTYFERLTEASLNSADTLFSLIKKYKIDCQARQKGWLRVDHCRKMGDVAWANAERWNQYGAKMMPVAGGELASLSGSQLYQTGIVNPKGGAIQPLSHVRGLANAVQALGANLHGNSKVEALIQNDKGWLVKTAKGSLQCQWVIVATNAYSDDLINLEQSILPFVSIQIATEQLPKDVIDNILPEGHTISDTRRVIMYARREPDNRIVFGSHGEITRDGMLKGFEWLKRDAVRIFPQLADVNWQFKWGGKAAVTHDRVPHFHEPAKGLVAGLGFNGRGVAMSHVMGETLADRVLGKQAEDLPFPIWPIQKVPFRNIQLLGKGTAIKYMQFLDKLESTNFSRI